MIPTIDRRAPGVRIRQLINDNDGSAVLIDLTGRIISFSYEDSDSKADKVSLQLDNFDLSLFEHQALAGGSLLEVSWGYPANMSPARRVMVKKLKGFTTLTVEGLSLAMTLNQESKTRSWQQVTRSDVVKAIAKDHGYQGPFIHVEDTDHRFDVINQAAETDAQFLRRLASFEGFDYFIDHTGFHWHLRKQNSAPTHILTWYIDPGRGDILSVNVESDLTRRVGKVVVRGRDPMRKTTVRTSANADNVRRSTLGEVIEVVDPETGKTLLQTRNATTSVHATPATNEKQVTQEAKARFRKAERSAVKLTLQVVGDPTLTAKSVVEVRGISSLLSGKYYVNEVKHTISASGYTCDLKLSRDSVNRKARPQAKTQGGEQNTQTLRTGGKLDALEVVDPESGQTHIEYHRTHQSIHADDPEAQITNRR